MRRLLLLVLLTVGCSSPAPMEEGTPAAWARWVSPDPVVTGRAAPSKPAADTPDVVLITIDTWRADRLGVYGSPRVATSEVLGRWAEQGTLFERAYAPSSWTWPTLASIVTGLYPSAHGAVAPTSALCDAPESLAESLWGRGLRTGFSGSSSYVEPPGELADAGFQSGFEFFWGRGLATGDDVLDRAKTFLDGVPGEPVFLHLHLYDPHCPYDPAADALAAATAQSFGMADADGAFLPDFATAVRAANTCFLVPPPPPSRTEVPLQDRGTDLQAYLDAYDGELVETDRRLGAIETLLRERGRWDGAWVVVTGDHGEEFGDHGNLGHGFSTYAETTRVPLVVRPPAGDWARGRREGAAISLVDLAPTLAAAVGARASKTWQGGDLGDALRGRDPAPRPVLAESDYDGVSARLFVDGDLALHRDARSGRRLYADASDPTHRRDLAVRRPADVERLDRALVAFEGEVARGARCTPAQRAMDPKQLEQLKALGYLE